MHKNILIDLILYSLLLAYSLLANNFAQADDHNTPTTIKVGGIYGLTGLLPDLGDQFQKGSQLFFKTTNKQNLHLSLTIEDSAWDVKTAVSAFKKLVETEGVSIVHVMGSGPSLAIKPLSEAKNILLLSAAAHPQLIPNSSLVIRHANLGSEDASTFAAYIAKDCANDSQIASIFLQNDWGENYNLAFRAALVANNSTLKLNSEAQLANESDFRSLLTRVLKTSPSALVINSAGNAVALIIQQARQLGFKGKIYANNGLALSEEVQNQVRALNDGKIFYQHYPAIPSAFRDAFTKEFNSSPNYFSMIAFTDFELLNYAIAEVGFDIPKIVHFIKSLGTFKGSFVTLNISAEGDILIPTEVDIFQ